MGLNKKSIDDVSVEGKRVLARVDYNVPLSKKDGSVQDDTRIRATLPTLKALLKQKPKYLVLVSHLGRPDGKVVPKDSLRPAASKLQDLLSNDAETKDVKVKFVEDCVGDKVKEALSNPQPNEIYLLENVRFHVEEEGKGVNEQGETIKASKEDTDKFRNELSSLADIYVNDAFGAAHRAHSSLVGVKTDLRVSGYLLKKELDYFAQALENPKKPFLAILGGAKVKDKIQIIDNLLDKVDEMMIVGGMAFTFKKIAYGVNIGKSLFDEEGAKIVKQLLEKAEKNGVKVHLPVDYVVSDSIDKPTTITEATDESGIPDNLMGLDIGPKSRSNFAEVISRAKVIVWNGPAGVFEVKEFANGSLALLDSVVKATENGTVTIIGGGDTASLVVNNNAESKVSHVSTGGGASLELLEGKPLPGVAYLSDK
jgi:phosphoglycerate kinase